MDGVLGVTMDPLGEAPSGEVEGRRRAGVSSSPVPADRRYVAWLSLVALAFNYNVWFCTARLAFPYHGPTANAYWVLCDVISDLITLVDICIWQPRLWFVKGGDIIVSPAAGLDQRPPGGCV